MLGCVSWWMCNVVTEYGLPCPTLPSRELRVVTLIGGTLCCRPVSVCGRSLWVFLEWIVSQMTLPPATVRWSAFRYRSMEKKLPNLSGRSTLATSSKGGMDNVFYWSPPHSFPRHTIHLLLFTPWEIVIDFSLHLTCEKINNYTAPYQSNSP